MKLSIIINLVVTMGLSASSFSQANFLTLNLENATFREIFLAIEEQSDYRFFYNEEVAGISKSVDLVSKNLKIKDVLDKLFEDTEISYKILENNLVVVVPNKKMLQQSRITGTVTDATTGEPLPGVNILIEGTLNGVITDASGKYSLEVPDQNAILIFSFIGYLTEKIPLAGNTVIDVSLAADFTQLEEVVVVGYGTQKAVNLTGSVAVVKTDALVNRATTNVSQSLQGKVSGMNFRGGTFGMEPGAEMNIQIRGQGSPLVLIDGVPGSMNRVNPNDIESISILKDAASAAIYGAQATYGVVLITTKSGTKDDKIHINFSSSLSGTKLLRMPHMLDSYTSAKVFNEVNVNTGLQPMFTNATIDRIIAYQKDPTLPETVPAATNPQVWGNNYESNANYDWFDVYYGEGMINQENISVSGGSKKLSYYLAAGHVYEDGVLKVGVDNYRRYNTIAKFDMNPLKWLSFSSNTRFANTTRQTPTAPSQGGYRGIFWAAARDYPNQYMISPNGVYSRISWIPMVRDGGNTTVKTNDVIQRFATEITPLKGWTINADYAFQITQTGNQVVLKTVYEDKVDGSLVKITGSFPNSMSNSQNLYYYNTLNAYTTYEFDIASKNHLSAMVGYQQEQSTTEYLYAYRTNLISQDVPSLNLATGAIPVIDGIGGVYATQGIFSRLKYNYDEKYLLEIDMRYDGTYKFASGNRWGYFPSFSAGWNLANENFWKSIRPVVNLLKFSVSYGALGNQRNATAYQDMELMGVNSQLSWIINGIRPSYTTAPNLVNKDITWETSATQNLGIDVGLLQNKLQLKAEIYKRDSYDQLGPSDALPAVIGAPLPNSNNMETVTNGWDVFLTFNGKIGSEFKYSVTGVMFNYLTKVTKYNNPTKILTNPYDGQNIGEIWGYVTKGLIKTQEEADAINSGNVQKAISGIAYRTGDVAYTDLTDDGLITYGNNTVDNPGDRKIIGNSTPRYQFSFNLKAEWKGFDFTMFWQGVAKRDLMLNYNMMWGFQGMYNTTILPWHLDYYRDAEADAYRGLGPNLDSYFPRPYNDGSMNAKNQITQTRYLQNGAYARLKTLQLGYTIPEKWTNKLKLQTIYLYASGENLLTITRMPEHFDPETADIGAYNGYSGYSMPPQRIITMGINIEF